MALVKDRVSKLAIVKKEKKSVYNAAKAGNSHGPAQGDYDIRDWEVVSLPHDWAAGQPFSEENVADWGYKPKGKGWYQKSFLLPEDAKGKTLFIEFEGVATHAIIYFNGSLVARNFNGYAPFMVEITDLALFGTVPNVLAVFVDATVWEGWWYEGGRNLPPYMASYFKSYSYSGGWRACTSSGAGGWIMECRDRNGMLQ